MTARGGGDFRLHHLGLAVTDLDQAVDLYRRTLGAHVEARGEREDFSYALVTAAGTELELMTSGDAESAVGKFLAKRGPGVHHVAYEVNELDGELRRLGAGGAELAGEVRIGVHGTRVAFIHPKSMGGVLTELVERPAG